MKNGHRFGRAPNPREPPTVPEGKVNLTDPDSKLVHGMRGWIQGYHAQAACNEQPVGLVLGARVTVDLELFLQPPLRLPQALGPRPGDRPRVSARR